MQIAKRAFPSDNFQANALAESWCNPLDPCGSPSGHAGVIRWVAKRVGCVPKDTKIKRIEYCPTSTGPPTQATGPPRSGAGVGIGMLRGAGDSLT